MIKKVTVLLFSILVSCFIYGQENKKKDFIDLGVSVKPKYNLNPYNPKFALAMSIDTYLKFFNKLYIKTGLVYSDHGLNSSVEHMLSSQYGAGFYFETIHHRYDFIGIPLGLKYVYNFKSIKFLFDVGISFEKFINVKNEHSFIEPHNNLLISQYLGLGLTVIQRKTYSIETELVCDYSYVSLSKEYDYEKPLSLGIQLSIKI